MISSPRPASTACSGRVFCLGPYARLARYPDLTHRFCTCAIERQEVSGGMSAIGRLLEPLDDGNGVGRRPPPRLPDRRIDNLRTDGSVRSMNTMLAVSTSTTTAMRWLVTS